jgi:hypothetical protein
MPALLTTPLAALGDAVDGAEVAIVGSMYFLVDD